MDDIVNRKNSAFRSDRCPANSNGDRPFQLIADRRGMMDYA